MVALGDFLPIARAIGIISLCQFVTSNEDRKIGAVTSQNGLHQESNEPTHILDNSSSCIDLIFNS